jgi:hypothetical protein
MDERGPLVVDQELVELKLGVWKLHRGADPVDPVDELVYAGHRECSSPSSNIKNCLLAADRLVELVTATLRSLWRTVSRLVFDATALREEQQRLTGWVASNSCCKCASGAVVATA